MARASRILRPQGLIVFAIVVLLVAIAWSLFADRIVQRGVEATGESIVGARVELASVDLQPRAGRVLLRGLQVANPQAPMTNLLEAEDIVVDLMLGPLLEKKVVVQDLAMTGVRFNTPRETSGALENPDPEAGRILRQIDAWADQIDLPELDLETLTGVFRTEALSADSLRTLQYAQEIASRADSLRNRWEAQLTALDPRPRIDSVRTLVERLEAFRLTPLNALQVPDLLTQARSSLEGITSLESDVRALADSVGSGIASLELGAERLAELRDEDLAYGRRLLNIPSLDAPTLSPALFGGTALTWLEPVLYWARTAERFIPPGLDPRTRRGPSRARADGTTVEFPGRATWPGFLLQQGVLGLEVGGSGVAAGAYSATVRNLTSAPSLLGQPLELTAERSRATQGPGGISLAAVLDHTTELLRDSVGLDLVGVELPEIEIPALDGRLDLGAGTSTFAFRRVGNQIAATLDWASSDVSWSRIGAQGAAPSSPPTPGTAAWVRELAWSTLTGVADVQLSVSLEGDVSSPSVSVTSNLGEALAESLRRELGQQIAEAEARLRAEVEDRIQPLVQNARARIAEARGGVAQEVDARRQEVEDLRARLEARIGALTDVGIPGE